MFELPYGTIWQTNRNHSALPFLLPARLPHAALAWVELPGVRAGSPSVDNKKNAACLGPHFISQKPNTKNGKLKKACD
jgi:hypothetical protein